jgi:hypothetical protein
MSILQHIRVFFMPLLYASKPQTFILPSDVDRFMHFTLYDILISAGINIHITVWTEAC